MPQLLAELDQVGHVARVETLRRRGVPDRVISAAVAAGVVSRPRPGWISSPHADRDQLRAIAVGGRIGCSSALRRYGVWSGVDDRLHLHVPRMASRLNPGAPPVETPAPGVWHPSVPERRRRAREVRLATDAAPRVHWALDASTRHALDWIVSPHTALADALRCMDAEHASAAIDSAIHEGVLAHRAVDAIIGALPRTMRALVDEFTGIPESGAESLFVRRLVARGFHVVSQVPLAGFGRYDGMIDGCVLFEVDGRGFHSGSTEFFSDRDRTLVAQTFGTPVVRPSARHVLEDWPTVLEAVTRTVEDAKVVRRSRGLDPVIG